MGKVELGSDLRAQDPVLPENLVWDLAQPFLSDHEGREGATFEVDESGGEARAYLLGDAIVVKTQRPHRRRPRTSLEKEFRVLGALEGVLAGRVPRPLGYDVVETEAGLVELLVMSRIPGRADIRSAVEGERRAALLADTASVLRTLHAVDAATLQADGLLPTDSDATALRQRLEGEFASLVDAFTERPGSWTVAIRPDQVARAALAALPVDLAEPPVLLHSNPGRSHVFVDHTGAFAGLIDFGDAYASHPALDLRTWPDPADRIALRDAYCGDRPVGSGFDAVWTVSMVLADMKAMVRRPDVAERAVAQRAAGDLAARLAEL